MMADQYCCFDFGIRSLYDTVGYDNLICSGDIQKALREADLTIGNLECAYNDHEPMSFTTHAMTINRIILRLPSSTMRLVVRFQIYNAN